MGQVTRLAVPAFFTLIAEPLFLLADSAIVGQLGTRPLAALGVASTLLLTATGVFVFLAYATTAVVARAQGAGQHERAIAAGFDGMWLALIIGAALTPLTILGARPLALALGGPELADQAATYLRISAWGLPAMLTSMAIQGLLRGLQDTTTPLWATTGAFALNTALNAVFVLHFRWGLAGSAAGTVCSQWVLTLSMLAVVLHRCERLPGRPHLNRVLASARQGAPLLIRTVALRAVLLLTTAVAARFGAVTMASHQIVSTVFSFLSFALDALAIAAQSMTGQALGRADTSHVRRLTQNFVRLGWIWGAVAAIAVTLGSWFIPLAFTQDPDVRRATAMTLLVMALAQPVAGVVFVLDGVLMGAGDGVFLAKAQVAVLAIYAPLIGLLWLVSPLLISHGAVVCAGALWLVYDVYLALRYVALDRRRRGDAWLTTDVLAGR